MKFGPFESSSLVASLTAKTEEKPRHLSRKGKIPAVVGWLDNGVGPNVCRALFKHGVPVVALAKNKDSVECKTRYAERVIEVPQGDSGIIPALNSIKDLFPEGAVFCPTNDALAQTINSQQARLASNFKIASPQPNKLALLGDKAKVSDLLARTGILYPETWILDSRSDIGSIVKKCRYPVIVKPSVKTSEWWDTFQKKAFRAETPEALTETLNMCVELAPSIIVQEWIDGPDSNMYSFNSYVGKSGRLLAGLVCQKLRQAPALIGVGSLAMHCEEPGVSEPAMRLIREADFRGLSSVQFKRQEGTRNFYFIEANVGRPALNAPIAEACGMEMQYTMYCDCADLPLPAARYVRFPGAKAIVWRTDLRRSLAGIRSNEMKISDWFDSLTGRLRSIDIHLDDPKVIFEIVIRKIQKQFR